MVGFDGLLAGTREAAFMDAGTLGPAGTSCHRAARSVVDDVLFPESMTGIVKAVVDGEFERGVIPVENSIEGSVTRRLNPIVYYEVAIVREIITPIHHALFARSENSETLASHS